MSWQPAERTATNPQTGERLALVGGQWMPYSQSATNPQTGERLVFLSGATQPRASADETARAYEQMMAEQRAAQTPAPAPVATPSIGQRIVGAGEAALTLATGAAGGTVGMLAGTAGGLARSILSGRFGTPEAVRTVEQAAQRGAQALTYAPRTETGREMAQAVGQTLGEVLPPVLPIIAAPGALLTSAAQQAPLAAATAGRAAAAAPQIARAAVQAPVQAGRALGQRVGLIEPDPVALDAASQTASLINRRSVGSAGLSRGAERQEVASQMPVPFVGPSALTAGQATRNFAQLQFEKEAAKLGEIGAPLRERVGNQTATMIANFDALVDRLEPVAVDPRQLGQAVDRALVNRVEVERRKVRAAYDRAEAAGEMAAPVQLTPLAGQLAEFSSLEGLVPMIGAVRKEAVRIGALAPDESGALQTRPITLRNAETLRQFVNQATDWTDRREALIGRRINESIDAATEASGGDLYRAARQLRARMSDEFENVGLTAQLLGTRRGTTERQVAFGDVFDKVILSSPIDETNKLRSTLLRSGPEGRQAWNDLKAAGLRYIKDRATNQEQGQGAVNVDQFGNPLISPSGLNRAVRELDADGKLQSLYGKRQAQILRDLAELSVDIYNAPPGAVNFSNTASAMQIALDSLGTWAVTGIPGPAATSLREAAKYVRNRKTRARIEAALRGQVTTSD